VATCTSRLSRNHDLGRTVAGAPGGASMKGVREGASTAQEARRRCHTLGLSLPLLDAVCSVMMGERKPAAVLEAACGTGVEASEHRPVTAAARGPLVPAASIKGSWQIAGCD